MKLKLAHATSVLVVLFTLSLTAYSCEKEPVPPASPDSTRVDPTVFSTADKIVAEQAEASATTVDDGFRVASNSPNSVLSTASKGSIVSKWLEDRAAQMSGAVKSKKHAHSATRNSHTHYEDIELDMGGGWCDLCGCWMRHGRDPNGTPQAEIGHPYVCQGGASTQNCWKHYYNYCFGS